jgi:FMN-dependent NADH-azoreductase
MKLLHIDSSILGKDSVTRQITAAAVKRFCDADPGLEVIYRDLFANPLSYLSLEDMPDYDLHLSLAPNAHLNQTHQEQEIDILRQSVISARPRDAQSYRPKLPDPKRRANHRLR